MNFFKDDLDADLLEFLLVRVFLMMLRRLSPRAAIAVPTMRRARLMPYNMSAPRRMIGSGYEGERESGYDEAALTQLRALDRHQPFFMCVRWGLNSERSCSLATADCPDFDPSFEQWRASPT